MHPSEPRKRNERLTERQQELAAKYMPMARAMAKPFKAQFPDSWEDFESASCMALVESAGAFDPDREVKFSTFARRRIWGGLCDTRRKRIQRSHNECPMADGCPTTIRLTEEVASDIRPVGAEIEAAESLEIWMRKLPRQHAQACRMIYLDDRTHAEVARAMGISPSRVTYMHLESLAMLGGTWNGDTRPMPPATRRRGRPRRSAVA